MPQPMSEPTIPVINVAALFEGPSPRRRHTDDAVMDAATSVGFFVAGGFAPGLSVGRAEREELLRVFELPESVVRPLYRQKFAATHANVYRGWFPIQPGHLTCKEGIDLGADVAHGGTLVRHDDPLRERTPLPPDTALPGWRMAVGRYYRDMETIGRALMRSLARSLGLEENFFDGVFEHGLSTLRLIRYPPRRDIESASAANPDFWVTHRGRTHYLTGTPHVDTGFLTLLAQDGVAGLQARHRNGEWLDVPPADDLLAVNFGDVLQRWSGGRIRATRHRVIGVGGERRSIPFFYEARADAEIRPLPIDPPDAFAPFYYGDHLWRTTTQFVEFKGMESLRKPMLP